MDIAYLLLLQSIRESSDFLATVFNAISSLGGGTVGLVVVSLIYWCVSKSVGTQLGFGVALSNLIGQSAKTVFCVNRPWVRDPRVVPYAKALPGASGYSFPSGHSVNAMSLFGGIGYAVKKRGFRIAFFVLALLIGFSRNFLGVHTPQDVIVGMALGALGIYISVKLPAFVEKKNHDLIFGIGIIVITILLLLFGTFKSYPMEYVGGVLTVDPAKMILDFYQMAGLVMGLTVGWFFERRLVNFKDAVSMKQRLIRAVGGMAGMLILEKLGKFSMVLLGEASGNFLKTFLPIVFGFVIWPAIFTAIEKKMN